MSISNNFLGLDSQATLPLVSLSASQSIGSSNVALDPISTGLARLDRALNHASDQPGGLLRGQVTEVFGPPGVGKTQLALSAASNVLRDGGKVIWIDTSSPIPTRRLQELNPDLQKFDNLIYFRTPTLPHLLALLGHPPTNFPPPDTALLVIDSVSSLFPPYFLNAFELKDRLAQGRIKDKAELQWLLNRRWNVTSELGTHLGRLAARNIAVLALNQAHTKIKGQPRATLHPVLAGGGWDNTAQTRITMYRDFPDERILEVTKRGGRLLPVRLPELIIPFRIEPGALRETSTELLEPEPTQALGPVTQPTPTRKRKAEDEIADSQDEESDDDYSWMNDAVGEQREKDDALP